MSQKNETGPARITIRRGPVSKGIKIPAVPKPKTNNPNYYWR